MANPSFQLQLFGAFMYVVDTNKVTILFLDGRQSALASDKVHFIDSHVPVIEVNTLSMVQPDVTGLLSFERIEGTKKFERSLWFLDRNQITLTPTSGSTTTPFQPYKNVRPAGLPTPGPTPPKNDDYLGWVVPMTDIDKRMAINPDAMGSSGSNPDLPVGISARLELAIGDLRTLDCSKDIMGIYNEFAFQKVGDPTKPTVYYGALSNCVSVDLGNLTGLVIQRIAFWDSTQVEVLNLTPSLDPEVITIWNAPMSSILKQNMSMKDTFVPHFELMYKVIDNPPSPLLVPRKKVPGPDFANVSCPPAQIKP